MRLSIEGPGGRRTVVVQGDSVTVGRDPTADLVLPDPSVSRRHVRLVRSAEGVEVEDLGARNRAFVDGREVVGREPLGAGEVLRVGRFAVRVEDAPPRPPAAPLKELHDRLVAALDLRRLDLERLDRGALRARAREALARILADVELPPGEDRDALEAAVLDEALGLGPLEALLADPEVSEIMVNRPDRIYVERGGRLELSGCRFSSAAAVLAVIERIVAPLGRRIDESSPLVDARLADGSRVNAVIPPLALQGPTITIRKFRAERLTVDDLVRFGTLTRPMARFLELCVQARKNVVISGGTGSGKTTLLNVIASFIPAEERIVTIEDAAELQLPQDHWIQLESRPANLEGKGAVTIRDLVKNALRMRPDRVVVGECRSGETLDMLQAMNTGHDGSLTTLHANSPRDAIARIETMVLMAGLDLPVRAIREQIVSAVQVVVQQTRFADGSRRITRVSEITGLEGDVVAMQDLFVFRREGLDGSGRVRGRHEAQGLVPRFCDELRAQGVPVDVSIFREGS